MFLNSTGSRCLGSIHSPSDLRQEPRSSPRGARVLLSSNRQLRGSGSRNGGWLSRCRHQSKSAAASLCSGLAACSCAGVEGADCRSRGVTWAAQHHAPPVPQVAVPRGWALYNSCATICQGAESCGELPACCLHPPGAAAAAAEATARGQRGRGGVPGTRPNPGRAILQLAGSHERALSALCLLRGRRHVPGVKKSGVCFSWEVPTSSCGS